MPEAVAVHICETDEEELRPCPSNLCEADVLAIALKLACETLFEYTLTAEQWQRHFLKRARDVLKK